MVGWLRRGRTRARGVSRPVRSEAVEATRVELAELAPDPQAYLGQLGYLTIVLFESLGRGATAAPTASGKSRFGRVAAEVLGIHEAVLGELRDLGVDPAEAMEPYRARLDDFQRRTRGDDWHEILMTCYLASGFLLDVYAGLAAGLPTALGERMSALLADDDAEDLLVEELREQLDGNPRLAARLAMWGRRLVGDILLVARSALSIDGRFPPEERVEPVFTELIAAHTRRMDALGLTA